jgi:hypothetical protein
VSAVFAASAVLAQRWNHRRERMVDLLRIWFTGCAGYIKVSEPPCSTKQTNLWEFGHGSAKILTPTNFLGLDPSRAHHVRDFSAFVLGSCAWLTDLPTQFGHSSAFAAHNCSAYVSGEILAKEEDSLRDLASCFQPQDIFAGR